MVTCESDYKRVDATLPRRHAARCSSIHKTDDTLETLGRYGNNEYSYFKQGLTCRKASYFRVCFLSEPYPSTAALSAAGKRPIGQYQDFRSGPPQCRKVVRSIRLTAWIFMNTYYYLLLVLGFRILLYATLEITILYGSVRKTRPAIVRRSSGVRPLLSANP